MIDLSPPQLALVKDILQTHVAGRRVVVFGSRVNGRTKPHSDLDLCIMGESPLTLQELGELRNAFSESDLPMRVDIVDWATTDPEFKEVIKGNCEDIMT